jgi:dCMP deaminase
VPSGFNHCIDTPCDGASYESGQGLDKCESIHAEMNAVINCKDVKEIYTAYCTTSPCVHCIKVLLNTGCKRLVMAEPYPHSDVSKRLWEQGGRIWDAIKIV